MIYKALLVAMCFLVGIALAVLLTALGIEAVS